MALKEKYKEIEEENKNKIKDKIVNMPWDDFIKEHTKLVRVLKEGSREELILEAEDQHKELCEKLKEFGIEEEDD